MSTRQQAGIQLTINGEEQEVSAPPSTPLLWALRNDLGLTGTKFGCGVAQCGACTVHVDGVPTRSCVTPLSSVAGKEITTIEGLATNGELHPVQQAWLEVQAPQCGYCQSGQIMSAAALLNSTPSPSDDQIYDAMSGNLCRCGTYNRIFQAIKLAGSQG
jgi:isoquinoline 1-oxidoreductase alpha subunit